MKNIFAIALTILLAISFSGCKNDIVISKTEIENAKIYNEINNDSYKDCLYDAFGDKVTADEQLKKVLLPTKTEDVKAYLTEMKKVCRACEDNKILADRKTTDKFFEDSVELLKTDEAQSGYYQSLLKTLKAKNLTFDDYVILAKEHNYYTYNKTLLEYRFKDNGYNIDIKKSFDEQFKEYIEELK